MEEPKLRKDAARNRERLLVAGRELFAQHGLEVSLNDVAHHAGVGVGTAYRRFSNKDELIDAIHVRQAEELEAILNDALAEPDPWDGVVSYLERSLAIQAKDRGMAQILSGRHTQPQPIRLEPRSAGPLGQSGRGSCPGSGSAARGRGRHRPDLPASGSDRSRRDVPGSQRRRPR
jgi:AcrR family transcriptional regulator